MLGVTLVVGVAEIELDGDGLIETDELADVEAVILTDGDTDIEPEVVGVGLRLGFGQHRSP